MPSRRGEAKERAGVHWARGSNLIAQGMRFGMAGGAVSLVYLGATVLLADVVGLPFQVALAISFCIALAMHFTLQRMFVWANREEFALPLRHQATRYLALSALQYGITVASTSLLPSVLGVSTELIYLVTVAVVVSVNFLVFRHRIFHPKPTIGDSVD